MTTKQMKFETSAHNELFNGVRKLADAVSVTMGPSGHNVVMDKSYGGPTVTRRWFRRWPAEDPRGTKGTGLWSLISGLW